MDESYSQSQEVQGTSWKADKSVCKILYYSYLVCGRQSPQVWKAAVQCRTLLGSECFLVQPISMYSWATINQGKRKREKKNQRSAWWTAIHAVCEIPLWPHQRTETQAGDSNNPESLFKFLVSTSPKTLTVFILQKVNNFFLNKQLFLEMGPKGYLMTLVHRAVLTPAYLVCCLLSFVFTCPQHLCPFALGVMKSPSNYWSEVFTFL